MQRPPFPAAIDNTMRSAFVSCPQKFFLEFMRHKTLLGPKIHLHAGGAFAAGMEVTRKAFYRDGLPADEAIALGWRTLMEQFPAYDPQALQLEENRRLTGEQLPQYPNFALEQDGIFKNKNPHRMGEAFVDYFREYPLETDVLKPAMFHNQPAVEFNFGIPIDVAHPETGEPIIYCGRFDMLAEKDLQLFVTDEKTTGSLGEYWSRRYELSAQFTGYCWAARQHGYPVVGAIIRGIGILKTEIKHVEVMLLRPDFLIDIWYGQLLRDIKRMIRCWEENYWDWDFAEACSSYGGCEFLPVCSIHPLSKDKLLEVNYGHREWQPLKLVEE